MATDEITSLVKFCTMEVGLNALDRQALRWSSPHLFNDPFEPDYRSRPNFTPDTLLDGLIKEAITMLFGPDEPTGKSNRLIAAIARWRDEERFGSEEEAGQVLHQLLSQVAQQQQAGIDRYLTAWQQFARSLRICSFSDKPDNMACWQRYGANHSGIALRFATGENTALSDPKRVTYSPAPNVITSLNQQINVAYGRETAPGADTFIDKLLSKDRDNSSEREWRCFGSELDTTPDDDTRCYNHKPFAATELKAVYLGLASKAADRDAVAELILKKYHHTKVYQAEALPGKYAVTFVPLTS